MPYTKYPIVKPGNKYGRLLVIREAEPRIGRRFWLTRCICGTEKEIRQEHLKNGAAQSCGCLQRERAGAAGLKRTKHGATVGKLEGKQTAEYTAWQQMKNRCTNSSGPHWANYGGRGIVVCDRWLHSFENFLADVGPKPSFVGEDRARKYSLGRIDNDGNYEPGNVEWQTYTQQNNNRRPLGARPPTPPYEPAGEQPHELSSLSQVTAKRLYRKISKREPWQIALYEASEKRKQSK